MTGASGRYDAPQSLPWSGYAWSGPGASRPRSDSGSSSRISPSESAERARQLRRALGVRRARAAGGGGLPPARRVRCGSERLAWAILGFGILSFALGDICFDFVYGGDPPPRLDLRRSSTSRSIRPATRRSRCSSGRGSRRSTAASGSTGAIAAFAATAVSAVDRPAGGDPQHARQPVDGRRRSRLPGGRPRPARDRDLRLRAHRPPSRRAPGPPPGSHSA